MAGAGLGAGWVIGGTYAAGGRGGGGDAEGASLEQPSFLKPAGSLTNLTHEAIAGLLHAALRFRGLRRVWLSWQHPPIRFRIVLAIRNKFKHHVTNRPRVEGDAGTGALYT